MDLEKNTEMEETFGKDGDSKPKHTQFIKMLTFRVVPAYYKEIEKVAKEKKISVSKLIRTYIKDGMKRDGELTGDEDKAFLTDPSQG
jgi:predicted HicB family RNase H-like nuclease